MVQSAGHAQHVSRIEQLVQACGWNGDGMNRTNTVLNRNSRSSARRAAGPSPTMARTTHRVAAHHQARAKKTRQVNSLLPNDLACVQHDQATQLNAQRLTCPLTCLTIGSESLRICAQGNELDRKVRNKPYSPTRKSTGARSDREQAHRFWARSSAGRPAATIRLANRCMAPRDA